MFERNLDYSLVCIWPRGSASAFVSPSFKNLTFFKKFTKTINLLTIAWWTKDKNLCKFQVDCPQPSTLAEQIELDKKREEICVATRNCIFYQMFLWIFFSQELSKRSKQSWSLFIISKWRHVMNSIFSFFLIFFREKREAENRNENSVCFSNWG